MATVDADRDYALALQIQDAMEPDKDKSENSVDKKLNQLQKITLPSPKGPIGIVDPYWELADPNPNIYELFMMFDSLFFDGILNNRGVSVQWSPRMTLCAGVCKYEPRGRFCTVHLSTPLLKLRPRKDLIETLLHEMIHAFLFVTENYMDRDGHGPKFQFHMNRINKAAGTNITIYHTFHDEVKEYRQHWWRCSGTCRTKPPFYGYVKRAMNRAPAPHDFWWDEHQRTCGGVFEKVKEPENYKKKAVSQNKPQNGVKGKGKGKASTKSPQKINDILKVTHPLPKTTVVNGVITRADGVSDGNTKESQSSKFPGQGVTLGYGSPHKSTSVTTADRSIAGKSQSSHNQSDDLFDTLSSSDSTSPKSTTDAKRNTSSLKKTGSKRPVMHDIRDMRTGTPEKKLKPSSHISSTVSSVVNEDKPCSSRDVRARHSLLTSRTSQVNSSGSKPRMAHNTSPDSSDGCQTEPSEHTADVIDLTTLSCPVCGLETSESSINEHLDLCLVGQTCD